MAIDEEVKKNFVHTPSWYVCMYVRLSTRKMYLYIQVARHVHIYITVGINIPVKQNVHNKNYKI